MGRLPAWLKTRGLVDMLQQQLALKPDIRSPHHTEIGERIHALVGSLNVAGIVRTTASCQGHGWPFVRTFPYVVFEGAPAFAVMLSDLLKDDAVADKPRLRHAWEMIVCLDQEGKPGFRLQLADGALNHFVRRKHLDADLIELVKLVNIALRLFRSDEASRYYS
jgi:hypothetical protein